MPSADHLLAITTAAQMAEWEAFWRIDPWGEERADLRAGIVASTVANANRGSKTKAFRPVDFMPYADRTAQARADSRDLSKRLRQAFMTRDKETV
jgi:hypothetical protein